jgi:diadenosine tetraphosphate (Ap4A) HIT family hydrolase
VSFGLHAKLAGDTFLVGDFALSRVLMMNDARYDWLILVPRRAGLTEVVDLGLDERGELMEEIARCVEVLRGREGVEKVNVGALGNIVRQLHVHVVARRVGDAAWPGPVWGVGTARGYAQPEAAAKVQEFGAALGLKQLVKSSVSR